MSFIDAPAAIKASFPARELKINKLKYEQNSPFIIVVGFILLAISGFVVWLAAPGLQDDYKISQNPIEINANISGKCKTSQIIMTNCKVTISYKGNRVEREFFFVDFGGKSYDVVALAAADNPKLMTIDLGVEKLWNRIILCLGFAICCFGSGIYFFVRLVVLKGVYRGFAKMSGQRLTPVLVPVKMSQANKLTTAKYKTTLEGKTASITLVGKKDVGPILIPVEGSKQDYALGFVDAAQNGPFLVDNHLKRFDLTEEERQKLYDSIDALI